MADIEFHHQFGVVMGDVEYDTLNQYALLGRLIVEPESERRKGIGTILHNQFVDEARSRGNVAIIAILETDSLNDMEKTRNFLLKNKYEEFEYCGAKAYRKRLIS